MPLYKSAQVEPQNQVIVYEEQPHMEDVVELHSPEEGSDDDVWEQVRDSEITFVLPELPGSDRVLEVEEEEPETKKDKNDLKEEKTKPKDPYDLLAYGPGREDDWARDMANRIPKHNAELLGMERAHSFIQRLLNDLSKTIRNDHEGKLDINKLERIRTQFMDGQDRLEDAIEKKTKKKKANQDEVFVKEARTAYTGGMVVTVPIFISQIARMLINGTVSGGKDITKLYDGQVKRWKLSDREQMELVAHLTDMGFPIFGDRAFLPTDEVEVSNNPDGELPSKYFA